MDVYREVQYRRDYTQKLGYAFGFYASQSIAEAERNERMYTSLYGIPEIIRNMKLSQIIKFYDLHREINFDFYLSEEARSMTVYGFFCSYVDGLTGGGRFPVMYRKTMDGFLVWAGGEG